MYTRGELVDDYTSGSTYLCEILDPDGHMICYVLEGQVDALLSHLNR